MDSYAQDWSGEHFKQTIIDLYLDAPSDGEQDLSDDEEMGLDNQHDSHTHDDYGYQRYIAIVYTVGYLLHSSISRSAY